MDPFEANILGAGNLVTSGMNKVADGDLSTDPVGELTDYLDLPMSDEELLRLKLEWESKDQSYSPKIKPRQETNKLYYTGRQRQQQNQGAKVVSSNLIFESQETFIPQALAKNPEPVVWSDNTPEGKQASKEIKTFLQDKADTLRLRRKLGVTLRQWSINFVGVLKHGWDEKTHDFLLDVRKPRNFVWDPDGYIDEGGNYIGSFLGERIQKQAKDLIEMFPKHKAYITVKCDGKLGTMLTYTEWWTDDYCFSTFQDVVLDKHKNEFFNYGNEMEAGNNHFSVPKMPYSFLSVFSLQEQPHDETNLIEQNIPNQDDINDQDTQVSMNLRYSNNSIAVSGTSFDKETARQAAQALQDGDPVLVPDGQVQTAIARFPASQLPPGLLDSLQLKKDTLRSVFGTQGLSASAEDQNDTVRGQILAQSHDSTRIGGGVGEALEQLADTVFNWWLQMAYVFYSQPHFSATIGTGQAVEEAQIQQSLLFPRRFIVSVIPNSMQPKDELSEMNLAIDLANNGWLDPITLFQKLDDPDPMETAKKVAMWRTNPQQYMMTYFPEDAQMMNPQMQPNPTDMETQVESGEGELSANPASAALSQVPISTPAM